MTLRQHLHRQLDITAWPGRGLSPLNKLIVVLILVAVADAVLSTEPRIYLGNEGYFLVLDLTLGVIFSIEFALRLWTCGERPEFAGSAGRLRYLLTPAALCDLLAVLPFWLAFGWTDVFILRLVRLLRVLMLMRFGRFSSALRLLLAALYERRAELGVSLVLAGFLLLFAATGLYLTEGRAQPEAFGSIPRALWASVVTLTTVGYGDVYPITLAGRIFGALVALAAVGLVAMPAGILAAAFSGAFQRQREAALREEEAPAAGGEEGPR